MYITRALIGRKLCLEFGSGNLNTEIRTAFAGIFTPPAVGEAEF